METAASHLVAFLNGCWPVYLRVSVAHSLAFAWSSS